MKISIISFIILLFVFATSCQNKPFIEQSHKLENQQWNAFETVDFTVNLQDKDNPYQVTLVIALTEDFTMQEFAFGLSRTNDDGESIYAHYVLPVRDAHENWLEPAVDGKHTFRLVLAKETYFNFLGNYTYSCESTMAKYNVLGVESFSIEITQL